MSSEIKYRYALDLNGGLVDVSVLDRASLEKGSKFFSLDFNQELTARLGKSRRKHFGHKPQTEVLGSKETYLHALGKKVFKDEYTKCKNFGVPFYLEYSIKKKCTRLKESYGIECSIENPVLKFDLTKYYTQIFEETRDGQFIPDLMLLNPSKGEKIYIEIAVTHLSSDKKVDSKTRIIEYLLNDEDDIGNILQSKNGINSELASLKNFKTKRETGDFCNGECSQNSFYYFQVTKFGKCRMFDNMSLQRITNHREINKDNCNWDKIEPTQKFVSGYYGNEIKKGYVFRYFAALAFKEGAKVKNCFLCKYHAENNSYDFDESSSNPIFCKHLKKQCGSNEAADCTYYYAFPEYAEGHYRVVKDEMSTKRKLL